MVIHDDLKEKIYNKVNQGEDCWIWSGSFTKAVIPVMKFKNQTLFPRRIIYEDVTGENLTEHLKSLCKNKKCVNPEHFIVKSQGFTKITDLDKQRFEEKTIKDDLNDCILWNGFISPTGYGLFALHGKNRPAHRVSYCIYNKVEWAKIKNLVIMHSCDNRRCVNPYHLNPGTQLDNIQDCITKGRYVYDKGRLNPELVEEVKNLRASGFKLKEISELLQMNHSTVIYIIYKK